LLRDGACNKFLKEEYLGVFFFFLPYIAVAFVTAEFNPFDWSANLRGTVLFITAAVLGFRLLVLNS